MMSFLGDCCKKKKKVSKIKFNQKASLVHPNSIPLKILIHLKRVSSFPLISKKGSVTVEAAVAIPLFLFAILNLLSIILIMGKMSGQLASMQQEAKLLSVHAHILGEMQSEWVCFEKEYKVEPIIELISFQSSNTIIGCKARKWIGYDVNKESTQSLEDEWVYITKTGKVYHRKRNCRYLNPSIRCGGMNSMEGKRNKNGEKYSRCEICGRGNGEGICFYTEYGNRIHSSLQCSGLKRTVKSVKLSEVGGRRPCSICGNS